MDWYQGGSEFEELSPVYCSNCHGKINEFGRCQTCGQSVFDDSITRSAKITCGWETTASETEEIRKEK